jgi:hypothetical protein
VIVNPRPLLRLALAALLSCTQSSAQRSKESPAPRLALRAIRPAQSVTLRGAVTYEFRSLTDRGYAASTTTRPSRWVIVRAVDAQGRTLRQTSTDERGQYALEAPPNTARIVAVSSVQQLRRCPPRTAQGTTVCAPAMRIDVAPDRNGTQPYEIAARFVPGTTTLSLHASLAEPRAEGGAFHILDTLVTGMDTVYRWSGRELAPFFVIWSHASGTDWSYYRGERPARSGRYALELMGGVRNQLATTDADQHDIFIILHEFGHFVFDTLSSDSSIGGMHPATVNTDPGVAWEEGRATWFASAILNDPRYRDAVGIEPSGQLRQDDDLEQLPANALRGLGSQRTVEEVLWDLSDGPQPTGALTDRDNDGVSLGPARVFNEMIAIARAPNAYPSLVSFLRFLVAQHALTEAQARAILTSPTNQNLRYPAANEPDPWPFALAVNGTARGKIDGLTEPAPSGGRANPVNGLDSTHAYRVVLARRATVTITLTINGTGRARDHSDLDLELRDQRSDEIASSRGETQVETISRALDPGTYLIYVRDGGNGNRANYSLRFAANP